MKGRGTGVCSSPLNTEYLKLNENGSKKYPGSYDGSKQALIRIVHVKKDSL